MKKILALILALCMVLALCACGKTEEAAPAEAAAEEPAAEVVEEPAAEEPAAEEPAEEPVEEAVEEAVEEVAVMSYADYVAAEVDDPVVIEAYVQAKESWWDNKCTVYTQDQDGAYFLYDMACSEEDYAKLETGTKIRVTGYKAEWSGEVEIADATFEILEGDTYVAEAVDCNGSFSAEALEPYMNQLVSFTDLTVAEDAMYNWDGSGDRDNSDVYVNLTDGTETLTFTVRRYLTDNTTDVYTTVEALKAGAVVDIQAFVYWYEGPQARIVSVTVK